MHEDVFIGVPTRGTVNWATATRLQEIRDENPGLQPVVFQPGGISVALTRNKIVQRFLKTDCQVLVMVDDDIAPPNNFLELRDCLTDGFGMVGVPHPLANPHRPDVIMLALYEREGDSYRLAETMKPGLNECDALGTGCVLISREVFDALGPAPFRVDEDPEAAVNGEDFLFCRDLQATGFKVGYCLPGGHFGDHHTTVSMAPLLKANLHLEPVSPLFVPDGFAGMNRAQRRQLAKR